MVEPVIVPFIGPSYVSRSVNIDAERSINLYPEITGSENGKVQVCLIGTPGKTVFATAPVHPLRGTFTVQGTPDRCFVVGSNKLYELLEDGSFTQRGTLRTASGFVSMQNNFTQLMIVDGVRIYIYNLVSGSFLTVQSGTIDNQGNPNSPLYGQTCTFLDDYLITSALNTNQFGLSDLGDGLSWDGLDIAEKEGNPDNIVGVATAHRQLFIFGAQTTEPWYNAGNATFPLAPISGVFIEQGCAAAFSIAKLDNTIFWVGKDKNGGYAVYRLNGYQPQRVSTHFVEKLLNEAGDDNVQNANAYCYQEEGHVFYVLNVPSLDTTPVFDAGTNFWHERRSINASGYLDRDRASFHTFAFGKHLLTDYQTGDIYVASLDTYVDKDRALRRIRIAPHYWRKLKYMFFHTFQVDMETGVGLASGQGSNPKAILRISNDGGHSFGSERYTSIGPVGKRKARARWTNLGRSRDRVHWFEISDPIKVVLLDATIEATEGVN